MSDVFVTTYSKYKETIVTSVTTAILLLITLAWNDVIQTALNNYFPESKSKTLKSKIVYALTITVIVVILQLYLFPIINRFLK